MTHDRRCRHRAAVAEADPDIGRNRLHGVLLRLRRGLGLPATGPISCMRRGGTARAIYAIRIDSWEFERVAPGMPAARPEGRGRRAVPLPGDVLSVSSRTTTSSRITAASLRRRFLRLTTTVLRGAPPDLGADDLAALARRSWALAPEDDTLCKAVVRTLARLGHSAEHAK